MPTALSRLGACGGTLEGHSCRRCTRALYRLCPFGLCLWPSPPRSCLPVRFRLGLGRPSPDAPRLRFAPAFVVRTGSRMARTAEPRTTAGTSGHPAEHPNFGFGRSAHNTQPTTGTKLISTLQATPNVVRRISDLSTSLLGTRNLGHTASQLDNKENTFSGDVRMCYERFHTAPSHPGPAHDCSTDRDVSVPARARAARRRRRL